jgi:hypothetical protein
VMDSPNFLVKINMYGLPWPKVNYFSLFLNLFKG